MFLEDKDIQKVLDTINGRTPEDEVLKDEGFLQRRI